MFSQCVQVDGKYLEQESVIMFMKTAPVHMDIIHKTGDEVTLEGNQDYVLQTSPLKLTDRVFEQADQLHVNLVSALKRCNNN